MSPDLVLGRAAVRELDRRAIEEHGVPSIVLMENAGRACADEVQRLLPAGPLEPVVVLCGPGNNGGDGLVIARTLFNRGVPVRAHFIGPRAKLENGTGDFATNAALWVGLGQELRVVDDAHGLDGVLGELQETPLVVDALFGTGLTRPLDAPWDALIRATNALATVVLAVDLPSGLDADTGAVLGAAIRAHTTVTFVAAKTGFTAGAGPEHVGRVVVAEIGIPRTLL